MKKILFLGFALACASTAMAQSSTTMVFTSGTFTAGNCQVTGPFTLQVSGQNVQVTGGNQNSACSGTGGGGNNVSTAALGLSSTTFQLGGATIPTLSLTSADAGVSCNVSGSDGFSSAISVGRAVPVNAPTVAGTITYTASGCQTTTAGNTVSLSPATAALTVTGSQVSGCSAGQTSSILGATLSRVCTAQVNWQWPVANLSYNGDVTLVDKLLYGTWGAYKKTGGKAFAMALATGTYVSLELNPSDTTHGLQWAANTTFGDGGTIWVSTTPGGAPINNGQCLQSSNGSNSLLIYPFPGYPCSVAVNNKYYVNIADVTGNGAAQCSNGGSSCGSSIISYTTY